MCIDENFDMKLREFLLKLLDDLSDKDRARLHFVLGSEVPRRLRESNEIESTLRIFDYLILNEKIFNSFPVALSACGRADWSKKLKGNFILFEQGSIPMKVSL